MKTIQRLPQYARYIEILLSKIIPLYGLRVVVPLGEHRKKSFMLPVADKNHAKDIVMNAPKLLQNASEVFFINRLTKQIVNL